MGTDEKVALAKAAYRFAQQIQTIVDATVFAGRQLLDGTFTASFVIGSRADNTLLTLGIDLSTSNPELNIPSNNFDLRARLAQFRRCHWLELGFAQRCFCQRSGNFRLFGNPDNADEHLHCADECQQSCIVSGRHRQPSYLAGGRAQIADHQLQRCHFAHRRRRRRQRAARAHPFAISPTSLDHFTGTSEPNTADLPPATPRIITTATVLYGYAPCGTLAPTAGVLRS